MYWFTAFSLFKWSMCAYSYLLFCVCLSVCEWVFECISCTNGIGDSFFCFFFWFSRIKHVSVTLNEWQLFTLILLVEMNEIEIQSWSMWCWWWWHQLTGDGDAVPRECTLIIINHITLNANAFSHENNKNKSLTFVHSVRSIFDWVGVRVLYAWSKILPSSFLHADAFFFLNPYNSICTFFKYFEFIICFMCVCLCESVCLGECLLLCCCCCCCDFSFLLKLYCYIQCFFFFFFIFYVYA